MLSWSHLIASDGLWPWMACPYCLFHCFHLPLGLLVGLQLLQGWRPSGALPSLLFPSTCGVVSVSLWFIQPTPLRPPLFPPVICVLRVLVVLGEGWSGCAFSPFRLSWADGAEVLPRLSRHFSGGGHLQSAAVITLQPVLSSLSFASARCRLSGLAFLRWCCFSLARFPPVDCRLSPTASGHRSSWGDFVLVLFRSHLGD